MPFVAETLGNVLQSVDCFRGKQSVDGDNEGDKGTALLVAFLLTFFLLVSLGSHETFHGVCVDIGVCI